MTPSSIPSTISPITLVELRQTLQGDMTACRRSTLQLLDGITTEELRQQSHPEFSPVGWHLGHIAFTESLWLLERLKGDRPAYPQEYCRLFAADGLPKAEREHLPALAEILGFMEAVRDRTLTYLQTAPLYDHLRLWRWVMQHESQHAETATFVREMHRWARTASISVGESSSPPRSPLHRPSPGMVLIPAGSVDIGNDAIAALDNERSIHGVDLDSFWIDRTPVTVGEYRTFMAARGYRTARWWTPEGWDWVQAQGIIQPLYWREDTDWDDHPVCGVSWYEADAYARFVGKRLPTEAEWEKAASWHPQTGEMRPYPWGTTWPTAERGNFGGAIARTTPVGNYPAGRSATGCDDLLGNVWEWTATWFDGYPDFEPYPYRGYSQTYFDQAHRVLRGGSWATRPWALRNAFRNWYHPQVRELFAGFRCALSA